MTSSERTRTQTGTKPELDGTGLRIGIACGRFNDVITLGLLEACRKRLADLGVADVTEVWVPGAFELPLAAKALTRQHDAVITLGAVIRGDTPHFEYVAGESASGCTRVGLDTGVPVVFGVLTTDTVEQAEERMVNGIEYAETAVEMAGLLKSLS